MPGQAFKHETGRGETDESGDCFVAAFVVTLKAAAAADLGKGPLDYPSQDDEPWGSERSTILIQLSVAAIAFAIVGLWIPALAKMGSRNMKPPASLRSNPRTPSGLDCRLEGCRGSRQTMLWARLIRLNKFFDRLSD